MIECPSLKDETSKEGSSEFVPDTMKKPLHHQDEMMLVSSKTSSSPWSLTLSAFRKHSVRLVNSRRSGKISDVYEYLPHQPIGHGAMSVSIRLAVRRSDGLQVAIKSVLKSDILRQRKRNNSIEEWEALRMLQENPNVVDLIDVFETENEIQMVLEYCSGGELFRSIQQKLLTNYAYQLDETKAAILIRQVLKALEDLHDRGIIHLDVKPENLLLNEDGTEIKLCDFGIARLEYVEEDYASDDASSGSSFSTSAAVVSSQESNIYTAPELERDNTATTAADMYSLGVTLYVLLHGYPPIFQCDEIDDEISVSFPSSTISEDAKDLIRSMLQVDPSSRITAKEALNSKW
eukprot:CAMPEP_0194227200 /NCGR_PEP_ID=MMETSP0156-20130528/42739_1 /TAXON_ID=33649 /ORGANISM="Thalassionema nitzschioides, Strain L26-B" /LENGTH=347 /DNA_ID=CAMNT_0038959679 /DNA_START=107 /DNA_END=1147 /DNA_ORIENTATION=-